MQKSKRIMLKKSENALKKNENLMKTLLLRSFLREKR